MCFLVAPAHPWCCCPLSLHVVLEIKTFWLNYSCFLPAPACGPPKHKRTDEPKLDPTGEHVTFFESLHQEVEKTRQREMAQWAKETEWLGCGSDKEDLLFWGTRLALGGPKSVGQWWTLSQVSSGHQIWLDTGVLQEHEETGYGVLISWVHVAPWLCDGPWHMSVPTSGPSRLPGQGGPVSCQPWVVVDLSCSLPVLLPCLTPHHPRNKDFFAKLLLPPARSCFWVLRTTKTQHSHVTKADWSFSLFRILQISLPSELSTLSF